MPPPEQTAAGMVNALGAHRYEGAINQMSQDLKNQVDVMDLKELVQQIDESQKGIDQASGADSQIDGNMAVATVHVRTGNGKEHTLQFPLDRRNGIWNVTSIDPVRQLAQPVFLEQLK